MGKIIGIDDAGRGPVIGPMVLAGVMIESKDQNLLKEMGAKDSKLLSVSRRRKISEEIKSNFEYHVEKADPEEIDSSLNINHTEAIRTAMIINKLTEKLNEKVKVVIDCPSINIVSWTSFLRKLLKRPEKINLVCEHKADANHPVVSAASILAKEKREEEIKKIKDKIGVDFGSGYPADPVTKKFLRENLDNESYRKFIRFSWKTVKNLKSKNYQKSLF